MKKSLIATLLLGLLPSLANAELVTFGFTDSANKPKTVIPKNISYLNASTPITYILSGGLDRKLQIVVKDASGLEIDKITSSIINIHDRMTVNGRDFYGKSIVSDKKLSDGRYTITAQILDMNNKAIQSNDFAVDIDTVGPVITGDITHKVLAQGGGNVAMFDYLEQRELSVSGVSDSNSGLDKAYFTAKLAGTDKTLETPVLLDPVTGVASWLRPSGGTYRHLFYKNRSSYDIGFKVFDRAGNVTEKHRISDFNGVCGEKKIHSIFNPKTNKWDLYKSGMTIYANPYKFRVSVPRSENTHTSGSKFGYIFTPAASDEQYAYFEASASIPRTYSYWEFTTTAGNCGLVNQSWINVKLANDIEQGPAFVSMKQHIIQDDSWHSGTNITRNTPYTIDKIEIGVSPRSYEQKVTIGSTGTCTVPANQSTCVVSGTPHEHLVGRGYIPYPVYIASSDGKFSNHYTYSYEYWDLNAPVFESIKQDKVHAEMVVYDADAVQDWRRGWWLPREKYIYAYDVNNHKKINLKLKDSNEPTYQKWWVSYDLTSLPEGEYRLDAFVKDVYGNSRTQTITELFKVDRSAPNISFNSEGKPLKGELYGLENLRITLSDANKAKITNIKLEGGPTKDKVYLAWSDLGDNIYRAEYPRLFPATNNTGFYTLEVTAKDVFDNTGVYQEKFKYFPANWLQVGRSKTLPSNTPLLDRKDIPVATIKSNVLRTDSGAIATGDQEVFFTLRSDSPYSVVFNGQNITPGETKMIKMNLGDTGEINTFVTPIGNAEGEANFMFDIPQLNSKFSK
ncbi:DUF4165 domain-containing protein [Photobacterium carnosum]|uniref:DUF4165 domain-containing protein n=3 Tax=Vibrionaceae TaxID=641 RepID=A0A2N4UWL3_9GAMM|nr:MULTISPECIES: Ig-like domain-containing protein [Photobacterium]MCD9476330.1 DUF4165 domain-containing protein [Photobacterium phosphoreum]MCD9508106.1 DUF4165 domain-containing protein [Photobacterium phosphoreum]MCD9542319.1 DUF4165 domain-containing protein [Photobacterium carnosum]MCD9546110.1 DUF4165 domain-containing protein [Photobacterium carnosum]MCD9550600.1 DUF4165 domain-containing protein [Photobacterium carnosum]